jgi:hypothetical protein
MNADPVNLYSLKRDHGGTVYGGGRRWVGPGPGHSRRDASLSVWLTDDGRPLIHSFAGDGFEVCASHLGIAQAEPGRMDRAAHDRQKRAREAEARRRENAALAFCKALWSGGVPVEGSPGAKYLDARAIGWFPADVVFHPNAPRGYTTATTGPALLALARSVTGVPKAVQATFLGQDCRTKISRATFGALLGAAVRLGPVGPDLAVAEGLETAASYAELEGIPAWATLGTANLEAFRPPSCVRRLTIAADGDPAGMKAAHTLAERLRSRCDVTIAAAAAGADWNDLATGKVHV